MSFESKHLGYRRPGGDTVCWNNGQEHVVPHNGCYVWALQHVGLAWWAQLMITEQTIPKVTEDPLRRFIWQVATEITQWASSWLDNNNTNDSWAD